MTPKEKANELWAKMLGGNEGNELTIEIDKLIAKQCALICVDEIIEAIRHIIGEKLRVEYYLEVEQEIKKL